MNRQKIEIEIRKALARITEEDVSRLKSDENLAEAIGLDSLGRLELLSEVEDAFDLTIYDIDSEKASTIGGMLEIVEAALIENAEAV